MFVLKTDFPENRDIDIAALVRHYAGSIAIMKSYKILISFIFSMMGI